MSATSVNVRILRATNDPPQSPWHACGSMGSSGSALKGSPVARLFTPLGDKLAVPIAKFDEGFTKPRYPEQVMMSYYQGGSPASSLINGWDSRRSWIC